MHLTLVNGHLRAEISPSDEEREQKLGLLNLTEESVRTNIPPQSEIEQLAGDIQEALTAEWSIEMT